MKKLFITLFFILPAILSNAQNVTEAQKNRAVSIATRFCELLAQYSSNGDEYINNDAKIFDLCSSQNITAYNELEGDKEDLLVSYLFTIMGEYDNNLDMTFTAPKIEQIFGLPEFSIKSAGINYESVYDIVGHSDIYIVVTTTQIIKRLQKTTDRKIIYSCNEDRIIAFTTQYSPFVAYQKALKAFSVKDYESVFVFVDKALSHKRFDLSAKKSAATLATASALYSNDIERLKKYSSLIGTNTTTYNLLVGGAMIMQGDLVGALPYLEKAESDGYEDIIYTLGLIYSIPDTGFQNIEKSKFYLTKGINSSKKSVRGASSFYFGVLGLNMPNDYALTEDKILAHFQVATDCEFEPAYLPLSILLERKGDRYAGALCDEKAYLAGSNVAKARLGHYLVSLAEDNMKSEGIRLLREASSTDIDEELEQLAVNTGLLPDFPRSKAELKRFISKF